MILLSLWYNKIAMKKIILILLLFIPLVFIVINASEVSLVNTIEKQGYSKKEKDISWEYIKDKLFNGKIDRNFIDANKLSGPILFTLTNATEQDSLAVLNVIEELKKVVPNKKVDFFFNFTKDTFSSFVKNKNNTKTQGYSYFDVVSSTLRLDFEVDEYQNKRGANMQQRMLYFSFNDSTSSEDRKKYIQFEVLRTICFVDYTLDDSLFLNLKYPLEATFNDPTFTILDKQFTDLDKFLVSKLYADDFKSQFSDYMYKTYPYRYANLFLNKKLAKIETYIVLTVYFLLLFLLSFGFMNRKKATYKTYFFSIFIVFFSLINLQWIYNYFIRIETVITLEQSVFGFLYLLISTFVVSFLLWFIEQKFINNYVGFVYQFFMKLVLTLSLLLIPFMILFFLMDTTKEFYFDNTVLFFLFVGLTLTRGLFMYLNHYSDSIISQKELELSKLKELNAKNELKLLHAHINPHFLYNSLNSITSLMNESTSKAEEMMMALSDLFRYSINRKGKKMSTVKEEVLMVRNYLKIEKIRFEERLQYTIDVADNLLEKEIPMYILQPLIENAVKHGISKTEENGEIHLVIKQVQNNLMIAITDNGVDFPENIYSGFGLQSVSDLLRLSYGDKANLLWTNTPSKKIEISIPIQFHL